MRRVVSGWWLAESFANPSSALDVLCVCITVHGLPLGAPHGRMGPVHRTLCNTIKRKICLSMRTPVHMRIYRNANMCLPRTGVGKTQKTNKNSGLSSQKGIFSFQTRQKLIMWPSYLLLAVAPSLPWQICEIPRLGRTGTPTRSYRHCPFRSAPMSTCRSTRCPCPYFQPDLMGHTHT